MTLNNISTLELYPGQRQYLGCECHGLTLNLQAPLLQRLLLEELLAEALDLIVFLVRVLAEFLHYVAHLGRIRSYIIWDAVHIAELWW